MESKYTYAMRYAARTPAGHIVTIPDQVAADQRAYDGRSFPVICADGRRTRATLRGEHYGLSGPGTGDPVVTL